MARAASLLRIYCPFENPGSGKPRADVRGVLAFYGKLCFPLSFPCISHLRVVLSKELDGFRRANLVPLVAADDVVPLVLQFHDFFGHSGCFPLVLGGFPLFFLRNFLFLTSSPRLKPGDSHGRGAHVFTRRLILSAAVLLRRHATLIREGLVNSPIHDCLKPRLPLTFQRLEASVLMEKLVMS